MARTAVIVPLVSLGGSPEDAAGFSSENHTPLEVRVTSDVLQLGNPLPHQMPFRILLT